MANQTEHKPVETEQKLTYKKHLRVTFRFFLQNYVGAIQVDTNN